MQARIADHHSSCRALVWERALSPVQEVPGESGRSGFGSHEPACGRLTKTACLKLETFRPPATPIR